MSKFRTERSTEAPMDFQWTNRPTSNIKPVWASSEDEPETPRKRPRDDLNTPPLEPLNGPHTPVFGANRNVPFIFQQPIIHETPSTYAWTPPIFSAAKAFGRKPEEIRDIDMGDATTPKSREQNVDNFRPVATGGLRRVYNSRMGHHHPPHRLKHKEDISSGEEESGEEHVEGANGQLAHRSSHQYTLNVPAPPLSQTDFPSALLGYLQFFFNAALCLLVLYLILQFVLTIQRDVEQRISERSMEIVQDIAMCAMEYRANRCENNSAPALVRQCNEWEACMNRDPTKIGRTKVAAEMIAEVYNSFVEPISFKAMLFTLIVLGFLAVLINAILWLYRTRGPSISAAPPMHPQPYPVQTATQYHPMHAHSGFIPATHSGWPRLVSEEPQTPTRRRRRLGTGDAVKVKP